MAKESPKIIFSVSQDFVPATTPEPTIPYFAIFSAKGPIEEQLVDLAGFEAIFGKPDILNYGITGLYPYLFLQRTGGVCYVRRALHIEDISPEEVATYAGATSRWIKDDVNDLALQPISTGILVDGFEDYIFPSSQDTRQVFKQSINYLAENVTSSFTFKVKNPEDLLRNATKLTIMGAGTVPDDDTVLSDVESVVDVEETLDYVKLGAVVGSIIPAGTQVREVYDDAGTQKSRILTNPDTSEPVVLLADTSATSPDILVDNNDTIDANMLGLEFVADTVADDSVVTGTVYTVTSKTNLNNDHTVFTVSGTEVTGTITSTIYVKVNSSLKEKDAFLVIALTPGKYGQDLTINIADNTEREDLFNVTVIENGVPVEGPYVCSRLKGAVDAYSKSQFIEDVINGTSRRIWIVDNEDAVSALDGTPHKPLPTNTMKLKPLPVPNYEDMNAASVEKVYSGDSVIKIQAGTEADILKWSAGDTLSVLNVDGSYDSYEVFAIVVDPVIDTLANITIVGTFQESHSANSVVKRLSGYIQGPTIEIEGNDFTVDIGDTYNYGSQSYEVVDSGSNYFKKGQDGKLFQAGDFIAAFDEITNLDKFPEELLLSDGGFATASVFSTLSALAKTRERCALYGSIPLLPLTTLQNVFVEEAIDYADSTLTSDKYSRLFAGNSKVVYGANQYWVSDHLFNIVNQYQNTIIREGVLPAANNRGVISGIVQKDITLSQEYQDQLEKKQINYSRKVGAGYTNMSNTTRFNIDSFFQYSHIIHYVNAIHSIVESVFQPYLQEVVTEDDVENVDTAIGNLLSRNLNKMTNSYESVSNFLSNGNGTTTWQYKLYVQPRDITTKILFDLTVTNDSLEVTVTPA